MQERHENRPVELLGMQSVSRPPLRILLALAVVSSAATALPPSATDAYRGKPVYIGDNADASQPLYRPTRWTPTGDGSLRFEKVAWRGYNASVATATAIAVNNDCDPSCASGSVTRRRIRLTASRPRIFNCSRETYVYSYFRFRPALKNRPSSFRLASCSNRFD